eukprot:782340-Pelagomonas_calceolata.AAC.4
MAGQLECSWAQQRQEHGVAVEGGRGEGEGQESQSWLEAVGWPLWVEEQAAQRSLRWGLSWEGQELVYPAASCAPRLWSAVQTVWIGTASKQREKKGRAETVKLEVQRRGATCSAAPQVAIKQQSKRR